MSLFKNERRDPELVARRQIDPEPGMITLSVEDDGPGMGAGKAKPGDSPQNSDKEETGGHGLGLLIVQDIAELYGGAVNIGTSPLGGAWISVMLPGKIEA
ncbi:ATP-binding protein [Sulfitobacter sp. M23508]|uniref:ATP-binding protein n=1 Tax=Sulfitobacter sp. M23508 TaxID=3368577 RepID=UPI0037461FB5